MTRETSPTVPQDEQEMHKMQELLTSQADERFQLRSGSVDDYVPVEYVKPPAPRHDRSLPPLAPDESRRDMIIGVGLLLVVLALYAYSISSYWAPADGGVDQNAYLVGGKQLARTGSTRHVPSNPFGYVGNMFIRPDSGDGFFPKYPIGLPLLFAGVIKATEWGDWHRAQTFAFMVSPASAVLAVAGMFFIGRAIAGSYAGLLTAITLATCEVMWALANVSNSHAACVAFVVWGMFFLVSFWQTGSVWRGALAGFLLGFACLIRYTEGLLVLPLALVVLFRMRWSNRWSYLRNVVPVLAWAVPVGAQVVYNRVTIGHWTGYDSSNESEFGAAFTWAKLTETWEQVFRTFYDQGLFFVLPLGIAGLMLLFGRSWRLAVVMLAWLLPGTLLYTSYYWSPDRGMAYARFFLTFFPAVLVGVAACARQWTASTTDGRSGIAMVLALGVTVAIASSVSTWRVLQGGGDGPGGMGDSLPGQFRTRLALATTGDVLNRYLDDDSVLFSEEGRMAMGPLNYLQFAGKNWETYSVDAFQFRGARGGMRMGMRDGGGANDDTPTPMQPARRKLMADLYSGKSDRDLIDEQNRITDEALKAGRKVFVFGTSSSVDSFEDRFYPSSKYRVMTVQYWKDMPEPAGGVTSSSSRSAQQRRRRAGFGGGPGGGPGGPDGRRGMLGRDESPVQNQWSLVEVRLRERSSTTTTEGE